MYLTLYDIISMFAPFTILAVVATLIGNRIADKPNFPEVSISELSIDPNEIEVYSGEVICELTNREELKDCHWEIIKKTCGSNEIQFIQTKEGNKYPFALVNLFSEEPSREDTVLVLNALTIKISCTKTNYIEMLKAFSILPDKNPIKDCEQIMLSSVVFEDEQEIKFAYACHRDNFAIDVDKGYRKDQSPPSLKLLEISKLANSEDKTKIDLLGKPSRAKEFFNISETGYLMKCSSKSGSEYRYSLYMRITRDRSHLAEARAAKGIKLFYKEAARVSLRALIKGRLRVIMSRRRWDKWKKYSPSKL